MNKCVRIRSNDALNQFVRFSKSFQPVAGQSTGIDCCLDPFGNLFLLGNLGYDLSLDQKGKNKLKYKGASDILLGKFRIAP